MSMVYAAAEVLILKKTVLPRFTLMSVAKPLMDGSAKLASHSDEGLPVWQFSATIAFAGLMHCACAWKASPRMANRISPDSRRNTGGSFRCLKAQQVLETLVGTVKSLWRFQVHVACLNEKNMLREKRTLPTASLASAAKGPLQGPTVDSSIVG